MVSVEQAAWMQVVDGLDVMPDLGMYVFSGPHQGSKCLRIWTQHRSSRARA